MESASATDGKQSEAASMVKRICDEVKKFVSLVKITVSGKLSLAFSLNSDSSTTDEKGEEIIESAKHNARLALLLYDVVAGMSLHSFSPYNKISLVYVGTPNESWKLLLQSMKELNASILHTIDKLKQSDLYYDLLKHQFKSITTCLSILTGIESSFLMDY